MCAHGALRQTQMFCQFFHLVFTAFKVFEDEQSCGVGERMEQRGHFHTLWRLNPCIVNRHYYRHIAIIARVLISATIMTASPVTRAWHDEKMSEDLVIGADGLARPRWASTNVMLRDYYDTEWGMPVTDEKALFERLCLEGFQSGLSWATILAKRENFRSAFSGFDPQLVADFTEQDYQRLMHDPGIVRNRLKIRSAIVNAQATLDLRKSGGLAEFIWSFKPDATPVPRTYAEIPTQSLESKALAIALKKHGFKFVGPTTMFALMEAIGIVDTHLLGSHRRGTSGVWDK